MEKLQPSIESELPKRGRKERLRQKQPRLKLEPRSQLGHDTSENLITLCVACHGRRHGANR